MELEQKCPDPSKHHEILETINRSEDFGINWKNSNERFSDNLNVLKTWAPKTERTKKPEPEYEIICSLTMDNETSEDCKSEIEKDFKNGT
ncbi:12530_t:CDS:2 [Dentiscutata erythropus]|uniref:12530_t:CDS:1 n=1 Tax=Dentiscutata erythropus TaxID=1348616 RepID=A0A9N8ZRU1_9GLOM|nr:12530_t:CDS:2 [Dentiscutata erythropus]